MAVSALDRVNQVSQESVRMDVDMDVDMDGTVNGNVDPTG